MARAADSWADYWEQDSTLREIDWRKRMEVFVRAAEPILDLRGDDSLLDIGCGPGHLARALHGRVREIVGVDTSPRFLAEARQALGGVPNVSFELLDPQDYTSLRVLGNRRFSVFVCLSVLQYYDSSRRVETLLREMRTHAMPGARALLADLPVDGSAFSDTWGLLRQAWKEKFLRRSFAYLARVLRSDYPDTRKALGLLELTPQDWESLPRGLGLEAELLDNALTISPNRRHLLIRF